MSNAPCHPFSINLAEFHDKIITATASVITDDTFMQAFVRTFVPLDDQTVDLVTDAVEKSMRRPPKPSHSRRPIRA